MADDVGNEEQSSKLTQDDLLPGEKIVGDTIYGAEIISDANTPLKGRAYGPNYAWSQENWLVFYNGYIQFIPGYLPSLTDGHGLVGGRQLTKEATSSSDSNIYSTTVEAVDALFTWGEPGKTYFYRGWHYFS